jgi:hypothetical protein
MVLMRDLVESRILNDDMRRWWALAKVRYEWEASERNHNLLNGVRKVEIF